MKRISEESRDEEKICRNKRENVKKILYKMKIRVKLNKLGIVDNGNCSVCESDKEIREYLFFKCYFSKRCLKIGWVGCIKSSKDDLFRLSEWFRRGMKIIRLQQKIIYSSLSCFMYKIWENRNVIIWEGKCGNFSNMMNMCIKDIIARVRSILFKYIGRVNI